MWVDGCLVVRAPPFYTMYCVPDPTARVPRLVVYIYCSVYTLASPQLYSAHFFKKTNKHLFKNTLKNKAI